jgi:hypothetical protein
MSMSSIRLYVNRRFGESLGNLIDQLSGASPGECNWIEVEQRMPGMFRVVGDNFTGQGTERGLCRWDDEVSDLDCDSDVSQCFGMSERLQWRDVTITPDWFLAPSVWRLKQGLQKVTFCAYDPDDI